MLFEYENETKSISWSVCLSQNLEHRSHQKSKTRPFAQVASFVTCFEKQTNSEGKLLQEL